MVDDGGGAWGGADLKVKQKHKRETVVYILKVCQGEIGVHECHNKAQDFPTGARSLNPA